MPRRKAPKVDPIERFPAKPRKDGRFQKRIHGRVHYFGADGNRADAIAEYNRVKDDLYAGRIPGLTTADYSTFTMRDLVNRYLAVRKADADAGRITGDWYKDIDDALIYFGQAIGPSRPVESLRAEDFAALARKMTADGFSGHYFNKYRECIAACLNYAYDPGEWIDKPVRFRKSFKRIASRTISKRYRLVSPAILYLLLKRADPQLRAMLILAACNGYGATDCGELPRAQVDFKRAGIWHYKRPKTLIDRDSPLAPEAVSALCVVANIRPQDHLLFRTKYGKPWSNTAVAHELSKLIGEINSGLREGHNIRVVLGDLRHTFTTYANELKDSDAWKRLMGHRLPDLKDVYVETIFIPRLRAVVEHVRERLRLHRIGRVLAAERAAALSPSSPHSAARQSP